jgi:DegV family protein with EDD domain
LAEIRIVTDSTSDLPPAVAREHGIDIIPLSVIHKGKTYLDGVDITPDQFYPMLTGGELPKTSQPTLHQFNEVFRRHLDAGREVISLHISGGLSSTVATAKSAASEFASDRIHVIDSGFLSYALAFQALEAAALARAGRTAEQVLERLARLRERMELLFTLDTLLYLEKGGRIGKAASFLGSLLNIKPVIRVDNGTYVPAGRGRSTKQALAAIVQYLREKFGSERVRVAVGQGRAEEQAKVLAELLVAALNVDDAPVLFEVGPVLGVHTGPGTVGTAVYPVGT